MRKGGASWASPFPFPVLERIAAGAPARRCLRRLRDSKPMLLYRSARASMLRGPKPTFETMSGKSSKRDKPWLFRTYAGHSTAKASNELYRKNLAKGQTGLSVAFDLPTQTG